MKRVLFCLLVLIAMLLPSCTESDADRVAKKIDSVYDTVRAVITDDRVIDRIPVDTLEQLKSLETKYLGARDEYQATQAKNTEKGWSIIREMASYGSALMSVVEGLPGTEGYSKEISVARTTIKVLLRVFG